MLLKLIVTLWFSPFSNLLKTINLKINIDKSQAMRVSRSNELLQIKVNNRELKEVDKMCRQELVIVQGKSR